MTDLGRTYAASTGVYMRYRASHIIHVSHPHPGPLARHIRLGHLFRQCGNTTAHVAARDGAAACERQQARRQRVAEGGYV